MATETVYDIVTGKTVIREYEFIPLQLEELKRTYIERLKSTAPNVVYIKAPLFKQSNVSLGLCTDEDVQCTKQWIQAVRVTVDTIEKDIDACQSEAELNTIIFSHDTLYQQALNNEKIANSIMTITVE